MSETFIHAVDREESCRRRAGFTLIEALVTISLISVLVSLLLPGLNRAREAGRVTKCASNLRQNNIAVTTYATDHHSSIPCYRSLEANNDMADAHVTNAVQWKLWHNFIGGDDAKDIAPNRRKLAAYGEPEMFQCPSDDDDWGLTSGVGGLDPKTAFEHYGSSYMFNNMYHPNQSLAYTLWGMRIGEIKKPSRTMSIADNTIWYTWDYFIFDPEGPHGVYFPFHDSRRTPTDGLGSYFFAPRCNVGFVDGHVRFMKLGPYGAGDHSINTNEYIIDPNL